MLLEGEEIRRDLIPKICSPEHAAQIEMWNDYHTLGLPFDCGWAEHPAVYIDIIKPLEAVYRKNYGNR